MCLFTKLYKLVLRRYAPRQPISMYSSTLVGQNAEFTNSNFVTCISVFSSKYITLQKCNDIRFRKSLLVILTVHTKKKYFYTFSYSFGLTMHSTPDKSNCIKQK